MDSPAVVARPQSAVVPLRLTRDGGVEVLLLTNKSGTRWVVPKGKVEPGMTPLESALKEAWEEGGATGEGLSGRLGVYLHEKRGLYHRVEVYAMVDVTLAETWPEPHRRRKWVPLEVAAGMVHSRGLGRILSSILEEQLGRRGFREAFFFPPVEPSFEESAANA